MDMPPYDFVDACLNVHSNTSKDNAGMTITASTTPKPTNSSNHTQFSNNQQFESLSHHQHLQHHQHRHHHSPIGDSDTMPMNMSGNNSDSFSISSSDDTRSGSSSPRMVSPTQAQQPMHHTEQCLPQVEAHQIVQHQQHQQHQHQHQQQQRPGLWRAGSSSSLHTVADSIAPVNVNANVISTGTGIGAAKKANTTTTTGRGSARRTVSKKTNKKGHAAGPAVDAGVLNSLLKEHETQKQRLARKAELARLSRKRKKTRMSDLEMQLSEMRQELERERKRRKAVEEKMDELKNRATMPCLVPNTSEIVIPPHVMIEESNSLHRSLYKQLAGHMAEVERKRQEQHQRAELQRIKEMGFYSQFRAHGLRMPDDTTSVVDAKQADSEMPVTAPASVPAAASAASMSTATAVKHEPGTSVVKPSNNTAAAVDIVKKLLQLASHSGKNTAAQFSYIKNHISLPMPLRFMEWAMHQNPQFYSNSNGLWASVMEDIGVSPEQQQQLLGMRDALQRQRGTSDELDTAFQQLHTALTNHLGAASNNLAELSKVLSLEQLAKLFAWVDQHGAVCIKTSTI
jgi:hypothetical protein